LNKKVIKACEIYSFPFFSLIKMRKTKFENWSPAGREIAKIEWRKRVNGKKRSRCRMWEWVVSLVWQGLMREEDEDLLLSFSFSEKMLWNICWKKYSG
jgi:hypothetical protein